MRATVDRAGLDPQGRLPKVLIRRVRKGDLSKVRDVFEQSFGDFLERQLGTRPRQAFNGAQYVHHRWLMEPWGCFVAEEDNAKIVGAALAVTWGTVGLLGPVAVLTHYHNQTIAQQLIDAGLVDEYRLVLCPVVLGGGRSLFRDKAGSIPMTVVNASKLDRGAVSLVYLPRT